MGGRRAVQQWTTFGRAVCLVYSLQHSKVLRQALVLGITVDEAPHCGKVPGRDNHFILADYNGGGMSQIFLIAKGIAKMIREDCEFEESGIPRIFKTTAKRLEKDVAP